MPIQQRPRKYPKVICFLCRLEIVRQRLLQLAKVSNIFLNRSTASAAIGESEQYFLSCEVPKVLELPEQVHRMSFCLHHQWLLIYRNTLLQVEC